MRCQRCRRRATWMAFGHCEDRPLFVCLPHVPEIDYRLTLVRARRRPDLVRAIAKGRPLWRRLILRWLRETMRPMKRAARRSKP